MHFDLIHVRYKRLSILLFFTMLAPLLYSLDCQHCWQNLNRKKVQILSHSHQHSYDYDSTHIPFLFRFQSAPKTRLYGFVCFFVCFGGTIVGQFPNKMHFISQPFCRNATVTILIMTHWKLRSIAHIKTIIGTCMDIFFSYNFDSHHIIKSTKRR